MGHEREGRLPRSKTWRTVVGSLASAAIDPDVTGQVASNTLNNVRERLDRIELDPGVTAAFEYLLALAAKGKSANSTTRVSNTPELGDNPATLRLAAAASEWVDQHVGSPEYGTIAKQALADTIANWTTAKDDQMDLFGVKPTVSERWQAASSAGGFSEVSRLFFARFTERYLNYFLEREASASIGSIDARNAFAQNLHVHVNEVSKHAFETSKITQSFAAGWYNRHATEDFPSTAKVRGFMRLAFQKIREELRRESLSE